MYFTWVSKLVYFVLVSVFSVTATLQLHWPINRSAICCDNIYIYINLALPGCARCIEHVVTNATDLRCACCACAVPTCASVGTVKGIWLHTRDKHAIVNGQSKTFVPKFYPLQTFFCTGLFFLITQYNDISFAFTTSASLRTWRATRRWWVPSLRSMGRCAAARSTPWKKSWWRLEVTAPCSAPYRDWWTRGTRSGRLLFTGTQKEFVNVFTDVKKKYKHLGRDAPLCRSSSSSRSLTAMCRWFGWRGPSLCWYRCAL